MRAVKKLTTAPGRPDLFAVVTPNGTVVELERDEIELLHLLGTAVGVDHWGRVLASAEAW